MPSYIIKRSPEHDEYLEWSTVVDAPVSRVMTRTEMYDDLTWMANLDSSHPHAQRVLDDAEERLERVDETGSSAYSGQMNFDEQELLWMEGAPENYGKDLPDEDEPSISVIRGKALTRDEVFEAVKEEVSRAQA